MPEPNEWSDFLLWETASRDTIDFKTIYVDMAGDLIAGLMLSQIIYWYLPAKDGSSKLRICRDNYYWIAKGREDWWDEIRISKKLGGFLEIHDREVVFAVILLNAGTAPNDLFE